MNAFACWLTMVLSAAAALALSPRRSPQRLITQLTLLVLLLGPLALFLALVRYKPRECSL